jgi:hypothetical protein
MSVLTSTVARTGLAPTSGWGGNRDEGAFLPSARSHGEGGRQALLELKQINSF